MTLRLIDNLGIVVDDLAATVEFFRKLGLELEGRATAEGEWAGHVTCLGDQRVEVAVMRTPDGHSRLELSRFLTPPVFADHRNAPMNALGYLRVMFAVDDLDETLARLCKHGAQLVAKWSSSKTRIGSATSVGPKDFSSDSPKNSTELAVCSLWEGAPPRNVVWATIAPTRQTAAQMPSATENPCVRALGPVPQRRHNGFVSRDAMWTALKDAQLVMSAGAAVFAEAPDEEFWQREQRRRDVALRGREILPPASLAHPLHGSHRL